MVDRHESDKIIIGRVERIDFVDTGAKKVPAKIDTGADSCSVWAQNIALEDDGLHCVFFGPESEFYTGEEHIFAPGTFELTRVANSFGHHELRYKVKLRIKMRNRKINGTFTLADRSNKLYPVLIGRTLLHGKFLVDVSKGRPLRAEENIRSQKLQQDLLELHKENPS